MAYDWTERAQQFGEEWRSARQFHEEWRKRWISWLAVASGGGIAVLLNFVSNLPDPSFGLRALLVPFWAFALSLVFVAVAAVLFGEPCHSADQTRRQQAHQRSCTAGSGGWSLVTETSQ